MYMNKCVRILFVCVRMHLSVRVCAHAIICACVRACVCKCTFVCVSVYVCVRMRVRVRVYIYACVYVHICTPRFRENVARISTSSRGVRNNSNKRVFTKSTSCLAICSM